MHTFVHGSNNNNNNNNNDSENNNDDDHDYCDDENDHDHDNPMLMLSKLPKNILFSRKISGYLPDTTRSLTTKLNGSMIGFSLSSAWRGTIPWQSSG